MTSDIPKTELYDDIYNILEASTDGEIAPLVAVLTDTPLSSLTISRAFERHTPNHRQYTDQIGDEIYRMAITALAHDKRARPAYLAMLEALSKQVGLPITPGDVGLTEATLLNVFTKQHLLSVPAAERQLVVIEACSAASRAASGLLSSDAWAPFASALLYLAYLRRTLVGEGRISASPPNQSEIIPAPVVTDGDLVVVVQVQNDEPVLTRSTIQNDLTGWQDLDQITQNRTIANLLYPMLEAVQPLIAGSQLLRDDTLWKVTGQGIAHIVQKGHQGMRGLAPVSAAGLMAPIALMSLASAMIMQHKLDEFEKDLTDIKATLQDLAKFNRGERRSILTGSIRYFQQIASAVLAGELTSEVLHGIEHHEVELLRVQDHLTNELREHIAALRAIKKEGWGTAKYIKAIQDHFAMAVTTYDDLLLTLRARSCAYVLLCAFPGREARKQARLGDIKHALRELSVSGALTIALDQGLRDRLQTVSSFETKIDLLSAENAFLDRASALTAAMIKSLNNADDHLDTGSVPLCFNLKVKDGRPIAIRLDDRNIGGYSVTESQTITFADLSLP